MKNIIQNTNRYMSSIKDFFIRPQRQTYYSFDLGPAVTLVNGSKCQREDFHLNNFSDQKLTVSFYHFQDEQYENCLIYLHTHNGSKLEALPFVEGMLDLGVNVCLFDFAGYGNSEGDTVTLGCKEIWDIECVTQHLKLHFGQYKFILWGRSMGAVAALLYLSAKAALSDCKEAPPGLGMSSDNPIIGGIYDSPFYSLEKLTLELGSKKINIPEILLRPLVFILKSSLKGDLDFDELELMDKMKRIAVPGVFITSEMDNFVHHSHSERLYKEYGGRKELIYIEKDHNQIRRKEDLQPIYHFVNKLNHDHPKRLNNVLANNLAFQKRYGRPASYHGMT